MKILQIAPRLPFPLTDGGAIGIFNITKYLALRGHAITLVCFAPEDTVVSRELSRYCRVICVQGATGHGVEKIIRSYVHGVPYTIEKFRSEAMMETLLSLCSTQHFDVVHTDHLVMAQYALALKRAYGLPIVLREHNYETTMLERFAENERNTLLKLFVRSEYYRMKRYEPGVCLQFGGCAMITSNDQERILQAAPGVSAVCIPAGVAIPDRSEENTIEPDTILFLSSLGWKPNVDGFLWFYRKVFPAVRRCIPDARIDVVGKGEAPALQTIEDDHVRLVGFVDDVAPFLRRAAVCIVPLFTGSGIRIKILEMMSYGKAIVTTPVGCEGITAAHGENIMIASDADSFAEAVIAALADPGLRDDLGRNARELAERSYAWETVAVQFETLYQSMLDNQRNS